MGQLGDGGGGGVGNLAGLIAHPVGQDGEVAAGDPCLDQDLLQDGGDGLERVFFLAANVAVEDLDPAFRDSIPQGFDQRAQADVFFEGAIGEEGDVGVAADEDAGARGEIGQRIKLGDLGEALFERGEARRLVDQFLTPRQRLLYGDRHSTPSQKRGSNESRGGPAPGPAPAGRPAREPWRPRSSFESGPGVGICQAVGDWLSPGGDLQSA